MPRPVSPKDVKIGETIYRNGNMHRKGRVENIERVSSNGKHRTMVTVSFTGRKRLRTEVWNLVHCRYPDW